MQCGFLDTHLLTHSRCDIARIRVGTVTESNKVHHFPLPSYSRLRNSVTILSVIFQSVKLIQTVSFPCRSFSGRALIPSPTDILRIGLHRLDCVRSTMCWCTVLLDDTHVQNCCRSRQQFLHQQRVSALPSVDFTASGSTKTRQL